MMRQCGDCQLCCKLVPVQELGKRSGMACKFQKFHKGCTVYRTPKMPACCAVWNCRWLVNDDTDELSRPDRSHYVIDLMPDYITARDNATGEDQNIQVVQIWIDPKHPEAHRDPALRRYLFRRAKDGIAGLIRFNEQDAIVLFAPPFGVNGEWHEITSGMSSGPSHSLNEVARALGGGPRMVIDP
jgi:hypothetical protein